jgi:hypothetical protein
MRAGVQKRRTWRAERVADNSVEVALPRDGVTVGDAAALAGSRTTTAAATASQQTEIGPRLLT